MPHSRCYRRLRGRQPKNPAAGVFLEKSRAEAETNLQKIRTAYASFANTYKSLAASYLVDEALEKPQRLAALDAVKHRTLMAHTKLSMQATTTTLRLVTVVEAIKKGKSSGDQISRVREIGTEAQNLLISWEELRLVSDAIENDRNLTKQMTLLKECFKSLSKP